MEVTSDMSREYAEALDYAAVRASVLSSYFEGASLALFCALLSQDFVSEQDTHDCFANLLDQ